MTKPTGRPRGRPKTKEYVTVMARISQELADQVRRYAGLKRQTISDVLRDGLLVLLQEDDPYRDYVSDRDAETAIMSDRKELSAITSDTKGEEQGAQTPIVSDMKKDNALEGQPPIASDVNTGTVIASDTKVDHPSIVSDAIPDFDPEKYVLGKLCPQRHAHGTTGMSVLNKKSRSCKICVYQNTRKRRQAKRQTQPA